MAGAQIGRRGQQIGSLCLLDDSVQHLTGDALKCITGLYISSLWDMGEALNINCPYLFSKQRHACLLAAQQMFAYFIQGQNKGQEGINEDKTSKGTRTEANTPKGFQKGQKRNGSKGKGQSSKGRSERHESDTLT